MTHNAGVLALGRANISHIVEMQYFVNNHSLYSKALLKQSKYIVVITNEGSTQIVTFMTLRAGVLALGRGHMSYS